MEFTDRKPQYPGRIKLKNVSTGEEATYDMMLADGDTSAASGYAAGTPLNKATFEAFKEDILNYLANNPGPQGEKGDRGEPGFSVSNKSFLVGSNEPTQEDSQGWYKIGKLSFNTYDDYHGKWLISSTYETPYMPRGTVEVDIRYGDSGWEKFSVRWSSLSKRQAAEYVRYSINSSREVIFYVYIPQPYTFYRIDIIAESNRDGYYSLFDPPVSYGQKYTTRSYTAIPPNSQVISGLGNADSSITVSIGSGATGYNQVSYNQSITSYLQYMPYNDWVINIVRIDQEEDGDTWFRFMMPGAKFIGALPIKASASGYTPGLICSTDNTYVYVGIDENIAEGIYLIVIQ